jgi:transposase
LCDANGLPLHVLLSAANTHDSKMFEPLLETNPAVCGRRGRPGRPRRRPDKLHADKGCDYRRCRAYLNRRGIKVRIARRGIEDKSKLGRVRWVVERTISWLLRFKRLGLRYDRTERTTLPLLTLACVVINTPPADQVRVMRPGLSPDHVLRLRIEKELARAHYACHHLETACGILRSVSDRLGHKHGVRSHQAVAVTKLLAGWEREID